MLDSFLSLISQFLFSHRLGAQMHRDRRALPHATISFAATVSLATPTSTVDGNATITLTVSSTIESSGPLSTGGPTIITTISTFDLGRSGDNGATSSFLGPDSTSRPLQSIETTSIPIISDSPIATTNFNNISSSQTNGLITEEPFLTTILNAGSLQDPTSGSQIIEATNSIPTPTPSGDAKPRTSRSSVSAGALAAISVILIITAVFALFVLCLRKRRRTRRDQHAHRWWFLGRRTSQQYEDNLVAAPHPPASPTHDVSIPPRIAERVANMGRQSATVPTLVLDTPRCSRLSQSSSSTCMQDSSPAQRLSFLDDGLQPSPMSVHLFSPSDAFTFPKPPSNNHSKHSSVPASLKVPPSPTASRRMTLMYIPPIPPLPKSPPPPIPRQVNLFLDGNPFDYPTDS